MNKKVLFIGPQGSGKSTQARLLSEHLKIPVISTGDIFRKLAKEESSEGQRINKLLSEGKLIDDETTIEVVKKRLAEEDCKNGFILDGYPRNLNQIKEFDPGFDVVFYLDLADEEAIKRLIARGREDDTAFQIAERLNIFHEQTDPILEYYKKLDLVKIIDGNQAIESIQSELRKVVDGQK